MDCPRCRIELICDNIHDFGLTCNAHSCPTCKGIWIGAEQLQDIELETEQRFVEIRKIPAIADQLKPLFCPQCGEATRLNKVENSRDKKVIMDVCPSCKNIWLDAGEMSAIKQEGFAALLADTVRWLRSR